MRAFHAFTVKAVAFPSRGFLRVLHNGCGFSVSNVGKSGLGLIFRNVKRKEGKSHRYLLRLKFPYGVAAVLFLLERCSPQGVHWRVSTGSGLWEAGSQSGACCCRQVLAASCLLSAADILLQWAASTHAHFIHTGQQAGLQSPHVHSISHEHHKQAFFVSFHTNF